MISPSILHRAQHDLPRKLQNGVVIALTTVSNPPAGFPKMPRHVALIQLDDGSHVMGSLITRHGVNIGQTVRPRMRLQQTDDQGLRIYDVSYEPTVRVPQSIDQPREFRGYIIALSGPSGVGKSTVSSLLAHAVSEYVERVPIITTRKKKTGDDGEYIFTTRTKFMAMQKRGEIISSTQIPSRTEERMYGYRAIDIEKIWEAGKIPVVVTEQALLEGLADHYSRRSILSFGLLPPGKSKRVMLSQLLHRLRHRGRDSEASIANRMRNAEMDLEFLKKRQELFDHIVVNEQLETVIDVIRTHITPLQEAAKRL